MNGSNDKNGNLNWNAIYMQWDRKRLEEELVRTAERLREMRNEKNQLQSLVQQLKQENRVQLAELQRLGVTNSAFAAAVVGLHRRGEAPLVYERQEEGRVSDAAVKPESDTVPVRQNSGRFQVEQVDHNPIQPIQSQRFSEGVEASMLEQERREAMQERREAMQQPVRDYEGSKGMQVARAVMARRRARQQEEYKRMLQRDTGFC